MRLHLLDSLVALEHHEPLVLLQAVSAKKRHDVRVPFLILLDLVQPFLLQLALELLRQDASLLLLLVDCLTNLNLNLLNGRC